MKDVNFVFKVFISRKCNLEMQMTLREKGRLGEKKNLFRDLIYKLSQNACVLGSCRRCCLQNLRLCATFFSWGYLNERGLENLSLRFSCLPKCYQSCLALLSRVSLLFVLLLTFRVSLCLDQGTGPKNFKTW